MKNIKLLLPLFITILLFNSCDSFLGEEIARIELNELTTNADSLKIKEVSINLDKNQEIAIWSEMDYEYEDNIDLLFQLEIWKENEKLGMIEIDPTEKNITLLESKTVIMGKTSWSFTGKNNKFVTNDSANYSFKAIIMSSKNPSLVLNKANIILKK